MYCGCSQETQADAGEAEVWRYEGGHQVYVTTHRDSWRGLSLCGLPRVWNRKQAAATAAAAPPPTVSTPLPTPRHSSNDSKTSGPKESNRRLKCPTSGGAGQTWGIQQQGATTAAETQSNNSSNNSDPPDSAATKTLAGTAIAAGAAAATVRPATITEPYIVSASAAVTQAAALPALGSGGSTPRRPTYTLLSRPSAFVRYEAQVEGFDTAWVNAPMFLVSIYPPPAAGAQHQQGEQRPQIQQKEQQQNGQSYHLDMLLSITQGCSLDVAPISLAVFQARVNP